MKEPLTPDEVAARIYTSHCVEGRTTCFTHQQDLPCVGHVEEVLLNSLVLQEWATTLKEQAWQQGRDAVMEALRAPGIQAIPENPYSTNQGDKK